MNEKDKPVVLTTAQVESMISSHDFSSVEGKVPAFIAFLLKSSPDLLKSALDVALQNQKILEETREYIHKISDRVIKEYTTIATLEQQSLANTNKALSSVLVSLSKKEIMSADDVDIYFQTLQEVERNNVRMDENRKQSEQFFGNVQDKEIINTQPKEHIVAKVVLNMIQTPQGSKLAAEAFVWLAKVLYKAYTK